MTTFSALFYHLVWSTKNRSPCITPLIEERLYRYLVGLSRNRRVDVIQIGGMPDHVHILARASPDQHIPNLIRDLKVSATKMVRLEFPDMQGFAWQKGYGIFSVSKSNTDTVKNYVANQKDHHRDKSFEQELRGLLRLHEIHFDERYLLD